MICLGDIADVRIGYSFREGVNADPEEGIAILQSKDVAEEARVVGADLVRAQASRYEQWLVTLTGDVVFQPRGARFPAILVTEGLTGALVAAPLYLIRPDHDRADAAYLAALINAPAVQAGLKAEAKGSYIPQVPADAIRALCLPLPPLPEQRAIAALADLARQEAHLAAEIAAQRSVWLFALARERDAGSSRRSSQGQANAPG